MAPCTPDQLLAEVVAVRVSPSLGVPVTVGGDVFVITLGAAIASVVSEQAVSLPQALEPVTQIRR